MEKWGLLVTGGNAPENLVLTGKRQEWYVVAADSGLATADTWGIIPDLIVGDMDSVPPDLLNRYADIQLKRYPQDKDQTDTEIGLEALWDRGFREVTVAGGDGGRVDHFIGILRIFERSRYPAQWILKDYTLQVIDKDIEIPCREGEEVSFFPSGSFPCRAGTRGLKWELTGLEWGPGDVGVSNVCTGSSITIEVFSGRLLMVRQNRGILRV